MIVKLIISALVFLSFQSVIAQNDWYVINSETTKLLNGVRFFNNTGYAVGDSGTILRTSNAGQNWTQLSQWSEIRFYDAAFSDINTAVAVGQTNNGYMMRTVNGGSNWTSLGLFFEPVGFYHVQFINTYTGYALGGPFSVYKTINSGQNWYIVIRNTGYNLTSLQFSSDSIGYCGGTAPMNPIRAVILKTTNYGNNWAEINTGILGYWVIDMAFLNDMLGFITVAGKIYKTTNGGSNWSLSYTTNMLNSIYFLNNNTGYAAGESGLIVKTTNTGSTWSQMTTGVSNPIRDIFFINENTGIAVGSNGLILRTVTSISGISNNTNGIPGIYSVSQNYPNPFNPVTNIRFNIPLLRGVSEGRGVFTNLVVFDMLGREITTLVNEQLQPGSYSVDWDASNFPSGVYFYKLETDGFTESRKMVLVK